MVFFLVSEDVLRDQNDSVEISSPPIEENSALEHGYHHYLSTVDEEDSAMTEDQDSSILRDAAQNESQVFDVVKSPDLPSKNIEEEAMDRGELQSIP